MATTEQVAALPEMPARLADRPRRGGFPLLFTTAIIDGAPDFRVSDPDKIDACFTGHLCAICGHRLDYWLVWQGSEPILHNRTFPEPAMHEDCIRYALAVCPFLAGKRGRREAALPEDIITEGMYHAPERPQALYLGFCRGYKLLRHRGLVYARSTPMVRLEAV